MPALPEQQARQTIDAMLAAAGWAVQDYKALDPRLYSMLRGEELPDEGDELSGYEVSGAADRPKDVAYNPGIPIETFDFIVTDECHRSIWGLWGPVPEYFDAHLIGLTATPSKQTIGLFGQSLVLLLPAKAKLKEVFNPFERAKVESGILSV